MAGKDPRVLIVGAGIAGLVAAVELAAAGISVTVLERASSPGGKLRQIEVGESRIDSGPTVLTLPSIFEDVFATAGTTLREHLRLTALQVIARHAWSAHERLDLYADAARSRDAVAQFAGPREAERFDRFCGQAREAYDTLAASFMHTADPSVISLVKSRGLRGLPPLWNLRPFATLWQMLDDHFEDPRLRQLYGRYATYCGSSPFLAPATLALIAHVEQSGVWTIDGGMYRLASVLTDLARKLGAQFVFAADVARIELHRGAVCGVRLRTGDAIGAHAVIATADVAALATGRFGDTLVSATGLRPPSRSLSAMTWSMVARTSGFDLAHHNVFFSSSSAHEFAALFADTRMPDDPTVYLCAPDHAVAGSTGAPGRLFVLINAPATGDSEHYAPADVARARAGALRKLAQCGLAIRLDEPACVATTPADFARLFPATGGALYGGACHGWKAAFQRPRARTRVPGLYLAGGSTHPGPGLPMAALSGRFAVARLRADLASTARSRMAGTRGGTSTR